MTNVLVIGHADADGHLIAEQVRRNLSLIDTFEVDVVVDPERTRDHRAWLKLDEIPEIDSADFVFFVDMMFAPGSYAEEAKALTDFVGERESKQFFLIDHHPLPLRRLGAAHNLRVLYRPDVFECALGPRSGMMVVAAICEQQRAEVADIRRPLHETLAVGLRRAAALGGDLPGKKLLALLKADRWDLLTKLGDDDPGFHRLPRGRRPISQPASDVLRELAEDAAELLGHETKHARKSRALHSGRTAMSYDADVAQERFAYNADTHVRSRSPVASPRDLEAIVTLLEVAALSLTTEEGATFTLEELIAEARDIGGDRITLNPRDIAIVLKKTSFIQRLPGKLLRLR